MALLPRRHDRLRRKNARLYRQPRSGGIRGQRSHLYDATLRNLELIGEAATRIPDDVPNTHPEIPWRMVIANRNRLIQGYLGIDDDTLWSIICDDVPELLRLLSALKDEERL